MDWDLCGLFGGRHLDGAYLVLAAWIMGCAGLLLGAFGMGAFGTSLFMWHGGMDAESLVGSVVPGGDRGVVRLDLVVALSAALVCV